TTRSLEAGSYHVIDQTMFVGDVGFLELVGELGFVGLLDEVIEASVIGLEDRVLRRDIDRVAKLQDVVKRRASEIADRIVEVVHGHRNAAAGCVENLVLYGLAVFTDELDGQLALAGELEVGRAVL